MAAKAAFKDLYRFRSRRSVVHSAKGIVSSSQPLASQAGLRILEQGGNAADAAVAVAAVLNLAEPNSTGIGGDAFCLFIDAKTKKVHSLNGSGRSSKQSSLETLRNELGIPEGKDGNIPTTSVHSVTVPGAASAWVDAVEKFGSGKLGLEKILEPAIRLGEDGYPVSEITAYYWNRSEERIRTASPNGNEMLKPDAQSFRAPKTGEIMKNPTLANTFKLLAKYGKKGFYEGPVAEALIKVTSDLGGHLTLDDLTNQASLGAEETDPISLRFTAQNVNAAHGGLDVWEHPPNGQGIVALMALGIIQELEKAGRLKQWTSSEHNSLGYLHVAIEALRLAFADAHWFVTDPSVTRVPTAELLSADYLSSRAALFSPDSALPQSLSHGSPAHTSSDTVYFATSDAEGNACSFINSNYAGFGTCIIPAGCGFTLQNRGVNFSLSAGHPNAYAPGKRPYHTIIPGLATHPDSGELAMAFGVMGGFMQPQGHVQVLMNRYVFGMDVQETLDAPRFCIGEGMPGEGGEVGGQVVYLEEGIAEEVVEGLKDLGHRVEVVTGWGRQTFGRGQVIERTVDGEQLIWKAGSDGRADGAAMPLI